MLNFNKNSNSFSLFYSFRIISLLKILLMRFEKILEFVHLFKQKVIFFWLVSRVNVCLLKLYKKYWVCFCKAEIFSCECPYFIFLVFIFFYDIFLVMLITFLSIFANQIHFLCTCSYLFDISKRFLKGFLNIIMHNYFMY